MLYLDWVEASFQVLAVNFIEEQAIGAPVVLDSALTAPATAFPSSATA